jgi:hypothetical protein
MDETSGIALALKAGVPTYPSRRRPAAPKACRRREEGRTHLLIHLPIEERDEDRWCRGRPDHAGFNSKSIFEAALVEKKAAIEYSFTPLGDMLEAPVLALYNWTRANCFPYSSRPRGALDFHQNA